MNIRAKGNATGVSLSPKNLHTFLIFPLPTYPYLQADKGEQAAFPEGERASLNVTCTKESGSNSTEAAQRAFHPLCVYKFT